MNNDRSYKKAQRLMRISHLLYRNPQGLSVRKLAQLCNVSKRSIQRDLLDLESAGIPLWEDDSDPPGYGILDGYYLPPIHLSLNDALALYLAARLLARYADSFNPHIIDALSKLAGILPKAISDHIHATVRDLSRRERKRSFVRVLNTLALGWASNRIVHIRHRAASSDNVHSYDFSPYFIEPSAVGYATYAIGHSSYFDDIHTFKVERILEAHLTEKSFEPPDDFNGPRLLDSAWGIMYGNERQTVILRFSAKVARRVQENHWHPSQKLETLADGECILRLEIANPEEMLYWIRGWGSQVEVLEPNWMRERLAEEAMETARQYGGINNA